MYDELVKRLRARADREDDYYEHGGDIINEAADAIEELDKLLDGVCADNDSLCEKIERMEKPRWIPVTKRLPCNETVLIYSKVGGVAEGKYNLNTGKWTQYRWSAKMGEDVTHWMPLPPAPKPPKEEE